MLGKFADGLTGIFREKIVWEEFEEAYVTLLEGLAMKEGCFPITEASLTTHTLAHLDKMCKTSGPVFSFWMAPGEQGNEEVASSINNRRYPLASAAKNANLNTAGSWLGFLDGSKEVGSILKINKSARKARTVERMYTVQDPRGLSGYLSFDGVALGRDKPQFIPGKVTMNDLFERIALDNEENYPYLRSTYRAWRISELAHREHFTLGYSSACIDEREAAYGGVKQCTRCECCNCSGYLNPRVDESAFIPLSGRGRYLSFADFIDLTADRQTTGLSEGCEKLKKSLVDLARLQKLDIHQKAEIKGILFESTCWQKKGGVSKENGLETPVAKTTIMSMIKNPKKKNGSIIKMDFFPDHPRYHSFLYGVAKYFFWLTLDGLETEGYVAVDWLNTLEGDTYKSRRDDDGNIVVELDKLLYKQQWPSVVGFRYVCPTGVAVAPGDKGPRSGKITTVYLIDCHPSKCPPEKLEPVKV